MSYGKGETVGKIAIITDSNTCIPEELVERYQIGIVPINLIFGEESLRDGVDISIQEFYARLREADPPPTSSAPSPAQYAEAFEEAIDRGVEGIVVITLSSKLSMAYNAANVALKDFADFPIRLVDGRMATIAQGFVALTAAEAAAQGDDLQSVAEAAEKSIPGIGFAIMLESLEYLHRGGRVPAIASLVGSAIRLNPILGNRNDGTVGIIFPSIGKSAAIKRILSEVERKSKAQPLKRLAVTHAAAPEEAEALFDTVQERFRCGEIYIVELTPVMGAHAGPGVIGLAYHVESPEDSKED
jgi:DegV family protein with EDD domain